MPTLIALPDELTTRLQAKAESQQQSLETLVVDILSEAVDQAEEEWPPYTLEELVERIKSTPPVPGSFHPATGSLAEALAASPPPDPDFDSEAWNREWAKIEDEIRRINREDDIAEGRG